MLLQIFAILLSFGLQTTASPYQYPLTSKASNDCPKGVHIVGVRGTLEKEGFGAMQDIADQLLEKIPGSDIKAIDYPASGITIGADEKPIFNFFQYKASEAEGLAKFSAELLDFANACPETGIVVMGYSQVSSHSSISRVHYDANCCSTVGGPNSGGCALRRHWRSLHTHAASRLLRIAIE